MDAVRDASDFCATMSADARAARADRQFGALAARERTVRAFVCHDARAARRRLATSAAGPLGGALIGVKDVIATEAFPTGCGLDDPDLSSPRHDAWCVARARRLGGVLLGKTICTALAYPRPGPTTNPHDARRSPGGSSSGSAAAVAAGFVSFAFGTQTAGSTIRPASYCGVVGFKPSYGLLPTEGIAPISTTLDHVGVFAVSPRDAWYLVSAMVLQRAEILTARRPRRVLVPNLPTKLPQEDGYQERLAALVVALRADGIVVDTPDLPIPIEDFCNLQQEICHWEAARILLAPGRMRVLPELVTLLGPYLERDTDGYVDARRRRQRLQECFDAFAAGYDAVLSPAATSAAPPITTTGDAVMNRIWTALHVPAISVPFWLSAEGLPLGLQLVGPLGTDRALVETAQWFHERRFHERQTQDQRTHEHQTHEQRPHERQTAGR
ncbi:MAG TPA: amidase [Acetobacteraceae bacterium]|jgi:amidase|nr:amidase [Acetobacteraceae bacterium]